MNLEKLSFEAPYVTTPQMVEVDRAMIEDFKIELIQMMENVEHFLVALLPSNRLFLSAKHLLFEVNRTSDCAKTVGHAHDARTREAPGGTGGNDSTDPETRGRQSPINRVECPPLD